jgi:peptidoglycan/LPS O-acetylase OafA/YrhL
MAGELERMSNVIEGPSSLRRRVGALLSLVRVPVRSGHRPYLDGWRGICILLVLVGHGIKGLEPLANVGVEFFFALSGCLMAEILVFRGQDVGLFLRRRVARIFPAVAVYVAIVGFAINVSIWLDGDPFRFASPIAALFYFHNYLPSRSVVSLFEHTWSLAVEEHSYLLLAGIVLIARRRPFTAAGIALAISALAVINAYRLYALSYSGGQFITWRTDVRAGSVLIPFALCILMRGWKGGALPRWISPVAALGAIPILFTQGHVDPLRLGVCTLLAALAVISLDECSEKVRCLLSNPVLLWLGTLSFSLYVWQEMFFLFAQHGPAPWLSMVLMLGFALASYKLVETPARDYLNSRWGRVSPARDTAPLAAQA